MRKLCKELKNYLDFKAKQNYMNNPRDYGCSLDDMDYNFIDNLEDKYQYETIYQDAERYIGDKFVEEKAKHLKTNWL